MCCFACAVSWATWPLFTGVPARCVALLVRCPGPLSSCSPVSPPGALLRVCGVLGHLAPVHRCARSVLCLCVACGATWLLFTSVPARRVVLRVRVPGHLAPVHPCARSVCCFACAVSWATWLPFTDVPARCVACVCGVLGLLAPVHRCARSSCCVACAVSWATWLLFTGVPAWCCVLLVRCPGPLGSCSLVCPLDVLCCVCRVLGHLAPVHRCARCVCCVACAVSWATWLLFTAVPARFVALRVRCPGLLGCCSPVCLLGVMFCLCSVLGNLAPFHWCVSSVRCSACAVSWATWLLVTSVPARCVVFLVRCPRPLGSCSLVCPLGALFCLSWATWLLFTGMPIWCVVLRVGPLGSCSPVCPLGVLCCVCGVLGPLGVVHWCARPVCCAVSWATWLLFTGVRARCVVLCVACAEHRCGALTRPSGRGLCVAGRGRVPSGRSLVRQEGGYS